MTRDELFEVAQADLLKPTRSAQLKWAFWHADAIADHEDARAYLDDLNLWDRSVRSMIMGTTTPTLKQAWASDRVAPVTLEAARLALVGSAGRVEATRQVLALLGRAGERVTAGSDLLAGLASPRPGQVSQGGTTRPPPAAGARTSTVPSHGRPAPNGRPGPVK